MTILDKTAPFFFAAVLEKQSAATIVRNDVPDGQRCGDFFEVII